MKLFLYWKSSNCIPRLQSMNFVSHYYLDREHTSSMFLLGISTPDLLSDFRKGIRLRQVHLPLIMESDASEGQIQFYNGVLRHFEVDRLFHSSDFFQSETRYISSQLRNIFNKREIERIFFVSHILLELMMDRILIMNDKNILDDYYATYTPSNIQKTIRLSEWISRRPLPGYYSYLIRFSQKKFLYQYRQLAFIVRVMRQIFTKVRLEKTAFLYDSRLFRFLESYQPYLKSKIPYCMCEIERQLCNA